MSRRPGLVSGLLGLFAVGAATRFRLRGRYWQWRDETAFGRGRPPAGELRAAALDYGRWTRAMRRLGKARSQPSRP